MLINRLWKTIINFNYNTPFELWIINATFAPDLTM
jgi:hypothetical protein